MADNPLRRLRVLHVLGPLELGGAQTQLLGLLRAAHGSWWDATLCATEGGALADEFRNAGVPVIELVRRGSPGLGRMFAVRRLVGRGDFDVVHAVLSHNGVHARIAVAGRRERPAVVVAERDVEPRGRGMRVGDRLLGRWTDLWIANSDAVARMIRSLPAGSSAPIEVIPNAVDTTVFRPTPAPRPGPPWFVGTVGRLSPEKGVSDLLQAAEVLASTDPDVVVRIAGSGPLERAVRTHATSLPIEVVGPLHGAPAVASFLAGLHLFVLPSLREGSPNALLEAAACGVPAVATSIPAVEELGLPLAGVCPPGDGHSLAAAISDALRNQGSRLPVPSSVTGFDTQAAHYARVLTAAAKHPRHAGARRHA